jgi:hypothetical protein
MLGAEERRLRRMEQYAADDALLVLRKFDFIFFNSYSLKYRPYRIEPIGKTINLGILGQSPMGSHCGDSICDPKVGMLV